MLTGDHRPDLPSMPHMQAPKASAACTIMPFFGDGPPVLSWRQAELYGLVPYVLGADGEPLTGPGAVRAMQLEQQRAIRRGVRFRPAEQLPGQHDNGSAAFVSGGEAGTALVFSPAAVAPTTTSARAPVPQPLDQQLTVILVTSPIASHPSTELLEKVVASFEWVPGLLGCRMLLVADRIRTQVKAGDKFSTKRGQVSPHMAAAYDQYLDRLEQLVATATAECDSSTIWANTEVIRLEKHCGFGHAVLRGLQAATTEYVMVVQHDHPFIASQVQVQLTSVLDFMTMHGANYVSLPMSSVWRHVNKCAWNKSTLIDLRAKAVGWGAAASFVPILFWYDGTHVARRSEYIRLVFEGTDPVPLGQFIEDTFGGRAMGLLVEDYAKWFPVFSMWVFQPDKTKEEALIYHLDGRKYKTDQQRGALGWGENPESASAKLQPPSNE